MIARLWQRDTSLFAPAHAPASVHAAIANRLGWLDAPAGMLPRLPEVRTVLDGARADGLTHLVLLGMGGSSLCADVLRQSAGHSEMAGRLTMVDSTDERTVLETAAAHNPAHTLFLVASKSGGTIEVTALERYFRQWVENAVGADAAGRHFVGITDPGTSLVTRAADAGYRHLWLNPPDIGGRYSALSLFGLVPAAWLGLDLHAMLGGAGAMAAECQLEPAQNPGYALGAFMAEHATAGRDKLTLLPVAPLGMWIEQLVAESTGKNGVGVLPIVDEPEGPIEQYGRDRAFVAMIASETSPTATRAAALEAAGHPVFRINVSGSNLGREFFRWEFATAVAGALLGVNPFDEPNVSDAKARTKIMLDHYLAHGQWPDAEGVERARGVDVRRVRATTARPDGAGYIALLDYLPTDRDRAASMERIRRRLRATTGAATTYGIGPRYLHSTGQFHKGGPNSGRFVLMTSVDATSTDVPGLGYTFSVLKHAQALGDVAALTAAGREVLHIHITDTSAEASATIERVLSE